MDIFFNPFLYLEQNERQDPHEIVGTEKDPDQILTNSMKRLFPVIE